MTTQLFLKPGVLRPFPSDLGKILAMIQTAVRLALQEDELPVTQLVVMKICFDEPFHQLRNTTEGISRQEAIGDNSVSR
jgi:hypothetical protein